MWAHAPPAGQTAAETVTGSDTDCLRPDSCMWLMHPLQARPRLGR